jgi:hypothetical protein
MLFVQDSQHHATSISSTLFSNQGLLHGQTIIGHRDLAYLRQALLYNTSYVAIQ